MIEEELAAWLTMFLDLKLKMEGILVTKFYTGQVEASIDELLCDLVKDRRRK